MNKNKIRKLLSMTIISGALMGGLHSTAYAVITDYAIKLNNEIYSYNKEQLEQSFLKFKADGYGRLYEDFHLKLSSSEGFYAFKDDKKGYVSYEDIKNGFLNSKYNNESFNINKFVETEKYQVIDIKSQNNVSIDGNGVISIKESEEKKDKIESTSSTSSSSSTSRGSKSSKRDREEKKEEIKPVVKVEKVVPAEKREEVKKEEKKVEKKEDIKPTVKVEKVVPAEKREELKKEEKKVEKKEDIKPTVKVEKVVPAEKREEVKKKEKKEIKSDEKKVPSVEDSFEAHIREDSKRVIKRAEKPKDIVSKKGDLSIKSEITQIAQKPYEGVYQETTILVQGKASEDGILELVGKKIQIKKGDNYWTIVNKIYNTFKGNEEWNVRFKYGQWGYMGNVTFTSKKIREHIDINIKNHNGLIFKVKNEQFGEFPIYESKETCVATVLNNSANNENINVKVYSNIIRKTFTTFKVEIKKDDTKEKIAEKVAEKLKLDNNIKMFFRVEYKEEKIILVQKEADVLNLSVTIE